MTKNNDGTFDGVIISFSRAYIEPYGLETRLICNGLDMHQIFAQLTAQDVLSLLPDQSTLEELKGLINEA